MRLRLVCLAAILLGLATGSGCCCMKGCFHKKMCDFGCGEMYWSEWHNDPPACCDPCDDWGCYTGHGCCERRCESCGRGGSEYAERDDDDQGYSADRRAAPRRGETYSQREAPRSIVARGTKRPAPRTY